MAYHYWKLGGTNDETAVISDKDVGRLRKFEDGELFDGSHQQGWWVRWGLVNVIDRKMTLTKRGKECLVRGAEAAIKVKQCREAIKSGEIYTVLRKFKFKPDDKTFCGLLNDDIFVEIRVQIKYTQATAYFTEAKDRTSTLLSRGINFEKVKENRESDLVVLRLQGDEA